MGLINLNFFRPATTPQIKKVVHVAALVDFFVAGCLYCYVTYAAFYTSLAFPTLSSNLEIGIWLTQTSLRFMSLWMPAIIVLCKLNIQSKQVWLIFGGGCILPALLAITATILIDVYQHPAKVREDYASSISNSIANHKALPAAVKFAINVEGCCGWSGSADFGIVFNISEKSIKDFAFMKELEICYNKTWTVRKEDGEVLTYFNGPNSIDKMRNGCGHFYKQLFQSNCQIIFYVGLIVDVVSIIFTWLSYSLYKQLRMPPVEVTRGYGGSGVTASQMDYSRSKTAFDPEFGTFVYRVPGEESTPIDPTDDIQMDN